VSAMAPTLGPWWTWWLWTDAGRAWVVAVYRRARRLAWTRAYNATPAARASRQRYARSAKARTTRLRYASRPPEVRNYLRWIEHFLARREAMWGPVEAQQHAEFGAEVAELLPSRDGQLESLRSLAVAMLVRAFEDVRRGCRHPDACPRCHQAADAQSWLAGADLGGVSLEACLSVLPFDPGAVRAAAARYSVSGYGGAGSSSSIHVRPRSSPCSVSPGQTSML